MSELMWERLYRFALTGSGSSFEIRSWFFFSILFFVFLTLKPPCGSGYLTFVLISSRLESVLFLFLFFLA